MNEVDSIRLEQFRQIKKEIRIKICFIFWDKYFKIGLNYLIMSLNLCIF